ncbi:MAG: purine-binding chemotaxis protein CheW [Candidatus Cloacimonetes bacterium]|nr:purine-binding chemotaxis protein CheW [Candidatus Cloacimonadota bacterium]
MNKKLIKHLSFSLLNEIYAIKIIQVKEILAWRASIDIPLCQEWVKGIINIRGQIIPVVNLNRRLGLKDSVKSKTTCIIVVELSQRDGFIGFEVDSVQDVLYVDKTSKEANPLFEADFDAEFIENVIRLNEETKVILNIDKIFGQEDIIFKGVS